MFVIYLSALIAPYLHAKLLSTIGWGNVDRHVCKDSQEAFLQDSSFGHASGNRAAICHSLRLYIPSTSLNLQPFSWVLSIFSAKLVYRRATKCMLLTGDFGNNMTLLVTYMYTSSATQREWKAPWSLSK